MNQLIVDEKDFGMNVLKSPEARAFFRKWRKIAPKQKGTWGAIREDKFSVNGKQFVGRGLISALRDHLSSLQGERCCYCRRRLVGIGWAKPIEHILPQRTYPQYTFRYRNLAVACFDCNHVKAHDNWSTWPPKRRQYVSAKSCEKFFHARHHKYDAHVKFLHVDTNGASISVYAGLTPQGRQLCTGLLRKSSERTLAISANPRFAKAMDKLRVQTQYIAATPDDEHMMNFLEALELSADP